MTTPPSRHHADRGPHRAGTVVVESRPVPGPRPTRWSSRCARSGSAARTRTTTTTAGSATTSSPARWSSARERRRHRRRGSDVDPSRVGERVAIEPGVPCRSCAQCLSGHYNLCPDMVFHATPPVDGTLAEYVTHHAAFAFALPDSVSLDEGAMLEPLSVGIWACRRAAVAPGVRVLVTGAGPVGQLAAQVRRVRRVRGRRRRRQRAPAVGGVVARRDRGRRRLVHLPRRRVCRPPRSRCRPRVLGARGLDPGRGAGRRARGPGRAHRDGWRHGGAAAG